MLETYYFHLKAWVKMCRAHADDDNIGNMIRISRKSLSQYDQETTGAISLQQVLFKGFFRRLGYCRRVCQKNGIGDYFYPQARADHIK